MGTAAYGGNGKGSGQWREANRRRQLQTVIHPGVPPPPPPGRPSRPQASADPRGMDVLSRHCAGFALCSVPPPHRTPPSPRAWESRALPPTRLHGTGSLRLARPTLLGSNVSFAGQAPHFATQKSHGPTETRGGCGGGPGGGGGSAEGSSRLKALHPDTTACPSGCLDWFFFFLYAFPTNNFPTKNFFQQIIFPKKFANGKFGFSKKISNKTFSDQKFGFSNNNFGLSFSSRCRARDAAQSSMKSRRQLRDTSHWRCRLLLVEPADWGGPSPPVLRGRSLCAHWP